jgi:hypothetical protein
VSPKGKSGRRRQATLGGTVIAILIAVAFQATGPTENKREEHPADARTHSSAPPRSNSSDSDEQIEAAVREQKSGFMITIEGELLKLLPDDEEGSRHQRFIVELESGRTLLIAHNIDLAPRVPAKRGDHLRIHGQYEWNERGGVLHWTHDDPGGSHEGGWIERGSNTYR